MNSDKTEKLRKGRLPDEEKLGEEKRRARAKGYLGNTNTAIAFPFHYGLEADSYTFYRVPKILFSEKEFAGLSTDAKMLYGLLLDRMQLSAKNNWVDEEGRIYIYFKIDSIMEALSCGNKKACSLLAELDDKKGIGLISRVKQGMGRPDRIYVHKCINYEMSKRHFMKCQNDTSCDVESKSHDVSQSHRNNNEKNNTKINDTESILSYPSSTGQNTYSKSGAGVYGSDMMDRSDYMEYFEKALAMDSLRESYPMRRDTLNEILYLIVDVCSSNQRYIPK